MELNNLKTMSGQYFGFGFLNLTSFWQPAAKRTFSVGVKGGVCVRELLCSVLHMAISVGAAAGVRSWRRWGGGCVLSKALKTLSLTMVDKSDVLLVCRAAALFLLTVRQAGWGRALPLVTAEHNPGRREAEGGDGALQSAGVDGTGPELFRAGGVWGGGWNSWMNEHVPQSCFPTRSPLTPTQRQYYAGLQWQRESHSHT